MQQHSTRLMNSETTPSPSAETSLWEGHTSQWVHFWYYFFCIVIALGIIFGSTVAALPKAGLTYIALIAPVLMWLIRWWVTKCTSYELTTQRLKIGAGILNRKLDELELLRVKDYAMDQPLFLRHVGLGNLTLETSDDSTPTVAMRAISNVEDVREKSVQPFSLSMAENASARWMWTAMMKA
jgi:uncharacterized membrane protein YdbT with pleckstrin-like domain